MYYDLFNKIENEVRKELHPNMDKLNELLKSSKKDIETATKYIDKVIEKKSTPYLEKLSFDDMMNYFCNTIKDIKKSSDDMLNKSLYSDDWVYVNAYITTRICEFFKIYMTSITTLINNL